MANKGLKVVLAVPFTGMSREESATVAARLLNDLLDHHRDVGREGSPWNPAIKLYSQRSEAGQNWLFFKPWYGISMCDDWHPDTFFSPKGYIVCTPQEVLDILVGYNEY